MKHKEIALGFVDSDERLTKLSSLLESAAGKHVGDLHLFRAKAIVDAIRTVNYINYDVIELVVKALESCVKTTQNILDAKELAFDILCGLPYGYGDVTSPAPSPTDEINFNHVVSNPPFADDDTQELPPLKADDICVHCSLFTATHGNLCSVCVDFQEVDSSKPPYCEHCKSFGCVC